MRGFQFCSTMSEDGSKNLQRIVSTKLCSKVYKIAKTLIILCTVADGFFQRILRI